MSYDRLVCPALRAVHARCTCATIVLMLCGPGWAQATESNDHPIGTPQGNAHPVPAAVDYALPDLPVKPPPDPDAAPKPFAIRPSLALIGDWTGFWQDNASIAQVGEQRDRWEVRSARLSLLGHIGSGYQVAYQVGGEYKGFDGDPDTDWSLTDLSVTFPLGSRTKLQFGKTKETFAYEMVGDAANLPQAERVLSPFFVSRNTGMRLTHVWGPAKRGTLSAGIYNDDWDIGSTTSRGLDVSARVTALIWDDPAGSRFLHVGAAFRHVASDGTLRYRGRPGSNVSGNFIDTGNIPADSALHLGVEGLLTVGPLSLQGEYVTAKVDSPTIGNPRFDGWYLTGSWVLTGESRPYDRNVGYARRVIPTGRWGAPELVVRYARSSLDDRAVMGGTFRRTDVGMNWWATTRWKIATHWGHVWLDRDGIRGQTDTLLTRFQWVY